MCTTEPREREQQPLAAHILPIIRQVRGGEKTHQIFDGSPLRNIRVGIKINKPVPARQGKCRPKFWRPPPRFGKHGVIGVSPM